MPNHSLIDKYPESPIQCYKLKLIGSIQVVIFVTSLILNVFLLKKFMMIKKLRKPVNTFVIALTVLNIIGSVGELPVILMNNFSCRYIIN